MPTIGQQMEDSEARAAISATLRRRQYVIDSKRAAEEEALNEGVEVDEGDVGSDEGAEVVPLKVRVLHTGAPRAVEEKKGDPDEAAQRFGAGSHRKQFVAGAAHLLGVDEAEERKKGARHKDVDGDAAHGEFGHGTHRKALLKRVARVLKVDGAAEAAVGKTLNKAAARPASRDLSDLAERKLARMKRKMAGEDVSSSEEESEDDAAAGGTGGAGSSADATAATASSSASAMLPGPRSMGPLRPSSVPRPPSSSSSVPRPGSTSDNGAATAIQRQYRGTRVKERKVKKHAPRKSHQRGVGRKADASRQGAGFQPRVAVGGMQQMAIALEVATASLHAKTAEAALQAEQLRALRAAVSKMNVELSAKRMSGAEQNKISANARQWRQNLDESEKRVRELERELEREREEVAALRSVGNEDAGDFERLMGEAADLESKAKDSQLEIRRLEDVIKARDESDLTTRFRIVQLERAVEDLTPPEHMDACLSPRSYADDVLISSRDDAIAAKEAQIALVTKANWKLMEDVNKLEDELQRVLGEVAKAVSYGKEESMKVERAEALVISRDHTIMKLQGREEAIVMSTKQNDRLLLLLQQEEQKVALLETSCAASTLRQEEVTQLYRKLLASTSEREAADAPFIRDSSALVEALGASQRNCDRLSAELNHVRRTSERKLDSAVAAARSELTERRTKQYTTLNRLMAEDEKRSRLEAENETLREKIVLQSAQLDSAKDRLSEKQSWREADARASLARMDEAKSSITSVAQQLNAKEHEVDALRVQLHDCTVTMTKMVARQAALEERLGESLSSDSASKEKSAAVEAQVEQLESEVLRQGRERMAAVQVRNSLEAQLKEAIASGTKMRAKVVKREVKADAGSRALQKRHAATERARARLWELLLHNVTAVKPVGAASSTFASAAGDGVAAGSAASEVVEPLIRMDASQCELGDADVGLLLRRLRGAGGAKRLAIAHLNLAGNRITDESVGVLAQLISSSRLVQRIDLSGNAISAEGVRRLAQAMESSAARLGAQHVYVQPGGTIEAVGSKRIAPVAGDVGGTLTTAGMTRHRKRAVLAAAEKATINALQEVETVAVIDVSGNKPRRGGGPAIAALEERRTPFLPKVGGGIGAGGSPKRRGARGSGGGGAKAKGRR